MTAAQAIVAIAVLAMAGALLKPGRTSEAAWAAAGALLLVATGLVPWRAALAAVGKGSDVYLFLAGMMLLAELARREGLFDHVAALCVQRARGSAARLFVDVYLAGVAVTVFMSNDATAVVLTPAVLAVARKARAQPLPYLLACAFVANAASFVLPISNPANLIVFGAQLPPLPSWLARFALPSLAAIVATYTVLRLMHRRAMREPIAMQAEPHVLGTPGRVVAAGVACTAVALLVASAFGQPLGWPALVMAVVVCGFVLVAKREPPWALARGVSWSVLTLVAALFVLVEGLERAGALAALAHGLQASATHASPTMVAVLLGAAVALVCNLMNNLPAGLVAGTLVAHAGLAALAHDAVLVGVDLGPNLSVTGSLATILWLVAIRREGESVSAWQFFKVGAVAMPAALAAALGVLALQAALGAAFR